VSLHLSADNQSPVPHAVLGTELASFALQTLGNLGAAAGITVVLKRSLARRDITLTGLDRGLLAGFVLCSSYSAITVLNGEVTLWLAFAVALGIDALDRNRQRLVGTAFAGAALVKVFPAVLGLWFVRRRAWQGLAAVLVTGLAGLVVGVLVFGLDLTVTYLTDVLPGIVEIMSLPGSVETATLTVSTVVLRVILPPTLGLWVLLCACLLVQYQSYNCIDPSARRGNST